ncbi:GNAT family N-acetyltransferase [Thermohalobacter berrensis]|uniref:N-acetyltransferase domain-containing protein n=1 Tax=Thermohalobacter berrensis TaxID=99594 RepID=A0A419SZ87_9FIRM|nr:GNAT family N-acetyltransferase [Thermohalobacter berrensis]RKD30564.1 hypothetical protein BET03_04300 [Thermohalobacter berrensis]
MLNIRRVNKEDREDIISISTTIWEGDDYIPNIVDKWIDDREGEFTVAELNGQVVGFAKLTVLKPGDIWLEGIRVDKRYRGLGIGKEMTRYFIDKAKRMKAKSISLSTYIENHESIKIIEKNGFKKSVSFKIFYGNDNYQSTKKAKKYKKVDNFDDISYILDSNQMKLRKNYIAFDWTFIKLDKKLLEELINRGDVYVLKENNEVKSTLILSNKMSKANGLSLSYIDGEDYYEDGLKFAVNKFKSKGYVN